MPFRVLCVAAALLPYLYMPVYSQGSVSGAEEDVVYLSGGGVLILNLSGLIGPTNIYSYRPALFGPRSYSEEASLVHAAGTLLTARVNGAYRVSGCKDMPVHRPGPILSDGSPAPPDERWRIYSLSINDKPGDANWEQWPVDLGAPVHADGTPRLYGGRQWWWVMNDLDSSAMHEATGNDPLGLEVHVLAWVPHRPHTICFQYTFINKGSDTLRDSYIAHFVDVDLRHGGSDLAGSDSTRGLMYAWQRQNHDPFEGVPPVFGACFAQTPRLSASSLDSARWNGGYLQGYRNAPISSITMPVKSSYRVDALSEPGVGVERTPERWHVLARGRALDGAVVDPHSGEPKRFWCDGDPLTGTGWLQDDGIHTTGGTVAHSSYGYDTRMMMSTGPFQMLPGDTQQVIITWVCNEAATPEAGIHMIRAMAEAARANDTYPWSVPSSSAIVDRYEDSSAVIDTRAWSREGPLKITAAGYRNGVKQTEDILLTPRARVDDWLYEAELPLPREAEGMDVHLTLHQDGRETLLPGAASLPLTGDLRISGMQLLEEEDFNGLLSRDESGMVFPRLAYEGLAPLRDLRLLPGDLYWGTVLEVDSLPANSWYPSESSHGEEGWDPRSGCLGAPIKWGMEYSLYSPVQNVLWYDSFKTPVDSSDVEETWDLLMEHVSGPSTQQLGVRITDASALQNRWYVATLRADSIPPTIFRDRRYYLVTDLHDSTTYVSLVRGYAVNGFNGPSPGVDGFRVSAGSAFSGEFHEFVSNLGSGQYAYMTRSHRNAAGSGPVSTSRVNLFGRENSDPSEYPSIILHTGGSNTQRAYAYVDSSYTGMVDIPLICEAVHRDGRRRQLDVVLSQSSPFATGDWTGSLNRLIVLRSDYGAQPKYDNTVLSVRPTTFLPAMSDERPAYAAFILFADSTHLRTHHDTVRIDFYHEVSSADRYRFNPFGRVASNTRVIPERFHVDLPFPNPSRDWIRLPVDLPQAVHVRADLYDVLGRHIRKLHNGPLQAGKHLVPWDGRDQTGMRTASGNYHIMIVADGERQVIPFVFLR